MQTECSVEQLEFQGVGCRTVVGRFDAGRTSSDGGLPTIMTACATTRFWPWRSASGICMAAIASGSGTVGTPWQAKARSTVWS
jgi:hypothetical protein